jgi:hypothetical protein
MYALIVWPCLDYLNIATFILTLLLLLLMVSLVLLKIEFLLLRYWSTLLFFISGFGCVISRSWLLGVLLSFDLGSSGFDCFLISLFSDFISRFSSSILTPFGL